MPPVGALITTVVGWVGTTLAAGGLGAFALRLGGSLLLSAASQALMPKPKAPVQARNVTIREPVAPRDLVYGRARKGGVIVFLHSTGAKNADLHFVVVLAAHRIKSIGAIYFDGEVAVDDVGVVQPRWAGKLSVEKRLGLPGQTAFDGLIAAAPDKWTAAHTLEGCAAIYLKMTFDQNAYPNGIPNISADIEGKDDVYDPRTDSYGYTENAALCTADYMASVIFGIGAGIGIEGGLNTAALIEAANVCDEAVPLSGGGTEPRYTCNGVITTSETPKTIIEGLLTAMAGRCAMQGGDWRLYAGAYRFPLVGLGQDDVTQGGLTLTTRVTMSANFNGVRGQFVSPANDWQPDDFPAYQSATYVAEDGGEESWRDLSLPFTISATMAQRLAKIELERARRQLSLKIDGKLSAWRAAVGETVTVDYARWGLSAKPFEVTEVDLSLKSTGDGAQLLPELHLRETSPLVFDWTATEAQIYAAAPRTNLPSGFDIATPGVPTVTESFYITRDGLGVKVLITVDWTAAQSAFVREYRLEASIDGGPWKEYAATTALTADILDAQPGDWQFRVKAVSILGVSSAWVVRSQSILGLTAPPSGLSNVTLQSAGGLAVLKWDRSIDVDVRIGGAIVIRHSTDPAPTWGNSYSMDRVAGGEAIGVVPLKPGSYLLRAEDSGGRQGPVTIVSTKGIQAIQFIPVTSLIADPDFYGAKFQSVVGAAGLEIESTVDGSGNPIAAAGSGVMAFLNGADLGSVKRVRLRSEIGLTAKAYLDEFDARPDPIDDWASFDGAENAPVDAIMEYRETDDDPAGTPVWTAWGRVDSHEIEARGIQARVKLYTDDRAYTPVVSTLRLHIDEVP